MAAAQQNGSVQCGTITLQSDDNGDNGDNGDDGSGQSLVQRFRNLPQQQQIIVGAVGAAGLVYLLR
jgi:hypothetical protein